MLERIKRDNNSWSEIEIGYENCHCTRCVLLGTKIKQHTNTYTSTLAPTNIRVRCFDSSVVFEISPVDSCALFFTHWLSIVIHLKCCAKRWMGRQQAKWIRRNCEREREIWIEESKNTPERLRNIQVGEHRGKEWTRDYDVAAVTRIHTRTHTNMNTSTHTSTRYGRSETKRYAYMR